MSSQESEKSLKASDIALPSNTMNVVGSAPLMEQSISSGGQSSPVPQTLTAYSMQHVGPLPDPATLALYAQIDKSLPDQIVQRAHIEQVHRHAIENKVLDAQIEDARSSHFDIRFGQSLGAAVSLAFLIGAVICGLYDQPWLGAALGGTTLLGIVTVIVMGKRSSTSENPQSSGHREPEAPAGPIDPK